MLFVERDTATFIESLVTHLLRKNGAKFDRLFVPTYVDRNGAIHSTSPKLRIEPKTVVVGRLLQTALLSTWQEMFTNLPLIVSYDILGAAMGLFLTLNPSPGSDHHTGRSH